MLDYARGLSTPHCLQANGIESYMKVMRAKKIRVLKHRHCNSVEPIASPMRREELIMFPVLMVCNTDMLVGSAQFLLRWAYWYVGLTRYIDGIGLLIFW
jgi:hypothetical protein